ncbi:hypothetical protein C1646_773629 [Rhizophagus diaphanus]|nr:hypothetical protein C1646_773629 [Rhizophagus diaphanus] [Rhizophagus sp. MUCL 43196]
MVIVELIAIKITTLRAIWQYKQYILQEEAKINRLCLELFFQSTLHSEKDKLASVSYDYDGRSTGYKAYLLAKVTMAKDTMLSAPNFEAAYIPQITYYHL